MSRQVLRNRFGRRVENVAKASDRDLNLLKILPKLRQAQDRLNDLRGDHIEGDRFAHRHRTLDHRLRADEQDQGSRYFAGVLDKVLAQRSKDAGVKGRSDIGCEALLPLRLHDRFYTRGLERLCADNRFDQKLLRAGAPIELLFDLLAQSRAN